MVLAFFYSVFIAIAGQDKGEKQEEKRQPKRVQPKMKKREELLAKLTLVMKDNLKNGQIL